MSELTLQQLQQAFMDELSGNPSEAFRALVKNNYASSKPTAKRRVEIYKANHSGARTSALEGLYPICLQILGEEVFNQLAITYVDKYTSDHWDLNFHAKDFDQHLAQAVEHHEDLKDWFYLPELARFEWAFHICYFADANPVFEVTSQDPDDLKFALDTSVQLLENQWPVWQIWHNNRNDKGDEAVEDNQQNYYHLIHRTDFIPQVYALSEAQYKLMVDCIAGKTLNELAELHGEVVSENIPLFIGQKWLMLRN
ncbi:MAG: DNA-binding domain-containing protein [Psychrosphaera sp.]|nr:DNA-binding domain-containing protein [Psychrosphaera sp.]